jgi:DNA processing protein
MKSTRLVLPAAPHLIRAEDPAWPAGLRDLADKAPALLRVAGRLPPLQGAIAIVGTRYADEEGLQFAHCLAAELAAAGRVIVSGGAAGIDAAAHRGALDGGGSTVAVLATGLRRPYPPQHGELFGQIAASGALVTEHEQERPPLGWAFLARNRLIAAMAEVVVVVQAPLRSGALATAALARKLERPVFTVPYPPWYGRGEGCLSLLRRGAHICTSTRDILSLPPCRGGTAGRSSLGSGEETPCLPALNEDCRAVLGALRGRTRHADELTVALGLHILRVQQALTQLLLQDLVVERGSGKYGQKTR